MPANLFADLDDTDIADIERRSHLVNLVYYYAPTTFELWLAVVERDANLGQVMTCELERQYLGDGELTDMEDVRNASANDPGHCD